MKTMQATLRTLLLIAAFSGATLLAGCDAASLTGPESVNVQATGGDGNNNDGGNGGQSHGESDPRNI